MKNFLIAGLMILAGLTSCEKYNRDVIFAINDIEFKAEDISMYDSSTHILYLKRSHSELEDIETGRFGFYDRGEAVLMGSIQPGYSSFMPSTPVIMSFPFMFQSFALRIESWGNNNQSIINNPDLMRLLKRHGLLHSGLAVTAVPPEISGTEMSFTLTVTNNDESVLLILDPAKTGQGLFRYFSNGLYLIDPLSNDEVFADNIPHTAPEPFDSWSTSWLTGIQPGESRSFTFNYTLTTVPAPGVYKVVFEFPGLSYQISSEDLYQGSSRIWLGDVIFSQVMTVE
ncbi:MAG: hypothetical protein MUE37_13440 [Bacteroidales bacterium]|jgi:hypothetical protein|nr:hypothetical protein [Bacteroidales bacterium]